MKEKSYILHGPESVFKFPSDTTLGQLLHDQIASYGKQVAQVSMNKQNSSTVCNDDK